MAADGGGKRRHLMVERSVMRLQVTTTTRGRTPFLAMEAWHHFEVLEFLTLSDLGKLRMASRGSQDACTSALHRVSSITWDKMGAKKSHQASNIAVAAAEVAGRALRCLDLPLFPGNGDALLFAAGACNRGSLHTVNLGGCAFLSDVGLRCLAAEAPGLVALSVAGALLVTNVGITCVAESCPLLENLCVKRCSSVGDYAVAAVAAGCPRLRRLDLELCIAVGDGGLAALGRHSARLSELVLCHCQRISDHGLAALARGCPALRMLDLTASYLVTFDAPAPDATLMPLSGLLALDVRDSSRVGDEELGAIACCAPNLLWFSAQGCCQVTDIGVRWLAEGCRFIVDLFLNGCDRLSDAALTAISDCLRIQRLGVEGCPRITDRGLAALARGGRDLRTLGLNDLRHITDRGVAALASKCPVLGEVFLNGTAIMDAALAALASGCAAELWHVSLNDCEGITAAGVELLGRQCRRLERLHLAGCVNIDFEHPSLRDVSGRCSVAFTSDESFGGGDFYCSCPSAPFYAVPGATGSGFSGGGGGGGGNASAGAVMAAAAAAATVAVTTATAMLVDGLSDVTPPLVALQGHFV